MADALHGFKAHMRQVLKGADQFANAILGGYCDECFSSRCWRNRSSIGWRIMMWIINGMFFNRNHCKESFERDNDLPEAYAKEAGDANEASQS